MREIQAMLAESRPVFIWAPTARCGVTMLQRLISSSREILVFGESAVLTRSLPSFRHIMSKKGEEHQEALTRLAKGDFTFWSSSVLPDPAALAERIGQCEVLLFAAYLESARKHGFDRFGVKEPMPHWPSVNETLSLLPTALNIFLVRHLVEVLRSYKARGWLDNGPADVERYSQQWVGNMDVMLGQEAKDTLLVMRHEDFATKRDECVEKVRAFVDVKQLDPTVLDTKVNTFASYQEGHAPDGYIKPADLTPDELAAVKGTAGEHMHRFGYSLD